MRVVAYGQSDVGLVREKNEDRAFVGRQLFVVADGMGGHRAGEVASAMLVDRLDELDASSFETMEAAQDALLESIRDANRRIFEHAQADPEREGMGTTVTAALLFGDTLLWGQVGDTCAYLLRDGALTRVTPDHSFVGALIEAGYISAEEARTHPQRSVILKAVGHKPELDVDAGTPLPLQVGDQVLIVSDGVHGVVDEAVLAEVAALEDQKEAVQAIVRAARDAGGPDNITVVLVRALADE